MRDANQAVWNRRSNVRIYVRADHLEPPERTVLELLRPQLGGMRMLDVGVGAGRTSLHFAPLVADYVGVDYAPRAVEAGRERFAEHDPPVRFELGDARDLSGFEDASFDFVLFSVNGLDTLDDEGRRRALAELARVSRPGGVLFFSSHNLSAIDSAISLRGLVHEMWSNRRPARRIPAIAKRLPSRMLQRVGNPSPRALLERDWAIVSKRWPPWAPATIYQAKPTEVRRQLDAVGFDLERMILPDGEGIAYEDALELPEPLWLNYLARRRS